MAGSDTKTTAQTSAPKGGTPIQTAKKSSTNLQDLVSQAQKLGLGGSTGNPYAYTSQDADATVQDVFTSLLGVNAMGSQYQRAVNIAMSQDPFTGPSGRQQAVENYVQSLPEYKAYQQNQWLDYIYQDLAQQEAGTNR